MDVPYVKAPYEADAQLAYMAQAGVIDYVITEDSDLLVYGAPKVIYKWKRNTGVGCLIEYNDLWQAFPFLFTRESFITLCVLSGCDYLDSLPNIGINRAIKFLVGLGNRNIFEELHNIATIIGVRVDVPAAYIESVKKAIYVFKHQIVYDFGLQQLCPCTPLQSGDIDYGDYAGDDSAELLIRSFKLKKVWLAPEDMNISRASDISWEAEEDADESFQRAYQTRQSGHAHGIKSIIDVVEWTVPGLPVLTLPLMMAKDDEGSVLAISLLEDEDPPTEVPFILFSTSSCYITYQEENRLLLWKWERMFTSEQLPPEVMNGSNTTTDDEWDKSSEESGDDIVMLLDDQEEQEDDNTTHYAFLRSWGNCPK
ncbi:exonuclease 1-like [Amphiura filiformis]|uniref:exonuclease 1-like n=1 Tax=Amphiura filiformis TaxID=82378 RepID=UPI003B2197A5